MAVNIGVEFCEESGAVFSSRHINHREIASRLTRFSLDARDEIQTHQITQTIQSVDEKSFLKSFDKTSKEKAEKRRLGN